MDAKVKSFLDSVKARNANEPEFMQAVEEVAEAIIPFMEANPKYNKAKLLENGDKWERAIAANLAADAPYR